MLPQWQCIKKVRGGEIVEISHPTDTRTGEINLKIKIGEDQFHTVTVTMGYFNQHRPTVGGYYVLYDSGYESYSPGTEFDKGYVRLPEHVPF